MWPREGGSGIRNVDVHSPKVLIGMNVGSNVA